MKGPKEGSLKILITEVDLNLDSYLNFHVLVFNSVDENLTVDVVMDCTFVTIGIT